MLPGEMKLITQSGSYPVTLAEALLQCHADAGVEDNWFTAAIKSATAFAETYQGRSYYPQTWELTFNSVPSFPVLIPRCPVTSIESIKMYDVDNVETTLDLDDFNINLDAEPARIAKNYGYTIPATILRDDSCFKIRFTTGYSTVPDADTDAVVAEVDMKNGAYTIAAQPDVPRIVTATRTVISDADTPGIITIVGTDYIGNAATEAITVGAHGITVEGTQKFKTITTVTGSGWAIDINVAPVKDKIKLGFAKVIAIPETVKMAVQLYIDYMYENRAGEVPEMPRVILDLLRPDRMYQ